MYIYIYFSLDVGLQNEAHLGGDMLLADMGKCKNYNNPYI